MSDKLVDLQDDQSNFRQNCTEFSQKKSSMKREDNVINVDKNLHLFATKNLHTFKYSHGN